MNVTKLNKTMEDGVVSLLANKPIWMFWIVYSVFSGIFFAIFYLSTSLLASRWWAAFVVVIAIGMIWGSFVYAGKASGKKEKEK